MTKRKRRREEDCSFKVDVSEVGIRPRRFRKERFYIKNSDQHMLLTLTSLVNKLRKDFSEYSMKFILDALTANSCNVMNTVYFLLDPRHADRVVLIRIDV